MEETKEEKIILLKSQIFDLQIKFGVIRKEIEDKLRELNELIKLKNGEGG